MTRKILLYGSSALPSATATYMPIGSRLLSVVMECDAKPTYDFLVTLQVWDGAAAVSFTIKYAGTKNGVPVKGFWHDFPHLVTRGSVPIAAEDVAISITPGTGCTGVATYCTGVAPPT